MKKTGEGMAQPGPVAGSKQQAIGPNQHQYGTKRIPARCRTELLDASPRMSIKVILQAFRPYLFFAILYSSSVRPV